MRTLNRDAHFVIKPVAVDRHRRLRRYKSALRPLVAVLRYVFAHSAEIKTANLLHHFRGIQSAVIKFARFRRVCRIHLPVILGYGRIKFVIFFRARVLREHRLREIPDIPRLRFVRKCNQARVFHLVGKHDQLVCGAGQFPAARFKHIFVVNDSRRRGSPRQSVYPVFVFPAPFRSFRFDRKRFNQFGRKFIAERFAVFVLLVDKCCQIFQRAIVPRHAVTARKHQRIPVFQRKEQVRRGYFRPAFNLVFRKLHPHVIRDFHVAPGVLFFEHLFKIVQPFDTITRTRGVNFQRVLVVCDLRAAPRERRKSKYRPRCRRRNFHFVFLHNFPRYNKFFFVF